MATLAPTAAQMHIKKQQQQPNGNCSISLKGVSSDGRWRRRSSRGREGKKKKQPHIVVKTKCADFIVVMLCVFCQLLLRYIVARCCFIYRWHCVGHSLNICLPRFPVSTQPRRYTFCMKINFELSSRCIWLSF